MFPKSSEVLRWWPESGRSITRACGDKFKKVEISSWFAKPIDCQHSVEKLVACYFIILCNVFTVAFVFYDIAVPRLSPWRVTCVYMSWLRDIYIPKMSLPNLQLLTLLCYFVALRCVTWMKSWIYWVYWPGCLTASPSRFLRISGTHCVLLQFSVVQDRMTWGATNRIIKYNTEPQTPG